MRTSALLSAVLMLSLAESALAQEWVETSTARTGFAWISPVNRESTGHDLDVACYTLPARIYGANRGQERYSITVVDYRGVEKLGVVRANACPLARNRAEVDRQVA